MTVTDVETSRVSDIMTRAFTEIGIKKRDINGRSQYGRILIYSSDLKSENNLELHVNPINFFANNLKKLSEAVI